MLKQGMKPTHPGEVLKTLYLEPLQITQSEAAENLGVTRKTFSMLLNGHQGISAEMALRLSKAFRTSPELWLNLQRNYDLWDAGRKVHLSKVRPFKAVKSFPLRPIASQSKAKTFSTSRALRKAN